MASVGSENGEQVSLNIMPMLDIFSILILFLLMSFSTDPLSHDITTELPRSTSVKSLDELPAIVVTKKEIYVNDKKILKLRRGKISRKLISQGAVQPVFHALSNLSKTNKKFSKKKMKKAVDFITVEVDKRHKFSLIKKIMLSAQQADFISFKLMVEKNE